MDAGEPTSLLKEFQEIRNDLIACHDMADVIHKGLKWTRTMVRPQSASIFLSGKDGLIERRGIRGIDKNGEPIEDTWFPGESYSAGKSFTGQATQADPKSGFGQPRISHHLDQEKLDANSRAEYTNKLGTLRIGASIPLNGRTHTYGVLEVINKVDANGQLHSDPRFTKRDTYWLAFIASCIATAISSLRRRQELAVLTNTSRHLEKPFSRQVDLLRIYNDIAGQIIHELTPYKACIIRIANEEDDKLEVCAKQGHNVSWNEWVDEPKGITVSLADAVYRIQEPVITPDISKERSKFRHIEWIEANRFCSHACFPLKVDDDRVMGTLSVFLGFPFPFHQRDREFLLSVGLLIATLTQRMRVVRQMNEAREESARLESIARSVSFDFTERAAIHDHKNDLFTLYNFLVTLNTATSAERERMIHHRQNWIEKRMEALALLLNKDMPQAVNVNHVTNRVVRAFRKAHGDEIRFLEDYDKNVPIIQAFEMQIEDVVRNLVSNAVKAIQRRAQGWGEIAVTTEVLNLADGSYLQLAVQDNGDGVRNEVGNQVFDAGYTTESQRTGTGLGLYIARRTVQNYLGTITFESTVGQGTTFYIRLPLDILQ